MNVPADYEKVVVERVVMSDSDLPGTIIRLPMVYGANDPLNRLSPYLKRMDDSRIREELGYKKIVPTEEALKRTIEWERNHLSTEMQQLTAPFLLDYETEDTILKR